jgi:AcrR family transcriptional regulator
MAAEPSDTRTALLDAALAEVLAHGIRRTTASDIARRANVSRQTLYRYWPDVQALLAALVTRELSAVVPRGGTADSLDEFAAAIVATADRIRMLPLVGRLRETDSELFARYILERLGTSQRGIHQEIAARIRAGQAAGFVRPGAPERLAAMILLITQSAIQSAPLVEEWLPPREWRHELHASIAGYLAPRGAGR